MQTIYKTIDDVDRVINAGKPADVINIFIESYLTGEAVKPLLIAENEYAALKAQPDQPDVAPVVDEDGMVLVEGYSPNAIRDARIAELEVEYPYLVDPADGTTVAERRPVPAVDVVAWRRQNYAMLRRAAYGSWQEQLDMQYEGTWDAHVAAVKAAFPKEQ